ncbi:hypothetical protein PJK55_08330 [Exiguobacterium sp. MMG028]|uniref:SH3 domain-containing protein n=1 Tax=Exiguobacterium sp. MMG028 TaxID=3021979 RepID=UPI0022FE1D6F|nr:hypothetical protein [Exiguobacterium sp. MMG028]MDA5560733.1 hypothetical protein [Exiguobacterium sp. MMG028]
MKLIQRIGAGLLALSLITVSPNPLMGEPATVSAATVIKAFNKDTSLKSGAYRSAKVLKHVKKGESASILAVKGSWTKVKVGTVTGWVASWDLTEPVQAVTSKVFNKDTSLKAGAYRSAKVLKHVKKGESASILAVKGSWMKVKVGTVTGWVASWDLSSAVTEPYEAIESFELLAEAYRNAGVVLTVPAGARVERVAVRGSWSEVIYEGKRGFVANWSIRKWGNESLTEGTRVLPSKILEVGLAYRLENNKPLFKMIDDNGFDVLSAYTIENGEMTSSFYITTFESEEGHWRASVNASVVDLFVGPYPASERERRLRLVKSHSRYLGEIVYGIDTTQSRLFEAQLNLLYDEFGKLIVKHSPDDHPEVTGSFQIGNDEFSYLFFNEALYVYYEYQ